MVLSEHWARTIQLADTAQLFMNDKDLQMAYQQLKKGADFAASAGNVETAHEMYELGKLFNDSTYTLSLNN